MQNAVNHAPKLSGRKLSSCSLSCAADSTTQSISVGTRYIVIESQYTLLHVGCMITIYYTCIYHYCEEILMHNSTQATCIHTIQACTVDIITWPAAWKVESSQSRSDLSAMYLVMHFRNNSRCKYRHLFLSS